MRGEVAQAPPPPELVSRAWARRLRRRRRRIIASSMLAVVLSIAVCAVSSVFISRTGTEGPNTPKAAAVAFLNSMAKNSINEFEQSLCKPKRYQAGAILREFNSGMVDVGQTLASIKWDITKQTKPTKTTATLDLDVTFVVVEKRDQTREERQVPMLMRAVSDRGWYICEIQILTL